MLHLTSVIQKFFYISVFIFLKKKYRRSESRCSNPSTSVDSSLQTLKKRLSGNINGKKSYLFIRATIFLAFARKMRQTLRKPSESEVATSDQTQACKACKKRVMVSHPLRDVMLERFEH